MQVVTTGTNVVVGGINRSCDRGHKQGNDRSTAAVENRIHWSVPGNRNQSLESQSCHDLRRFPDQRLVAVDTRVDPSEDEVHTQRQ